jgi:hypothetical protein
MHTSVWQIVVRAAFVAVVVSASVGAAPAPVPGSYGVKTPYRAKVPISFTDFELTFLGERRVASEQYPRGFVAYDFQIVHGKARLMVTWSAGTGDIGPTSFAVAGQRFLLELRRSDKLGQLKPGELVITKVEPPG